MIEKISDHDSFFSSRNAISEFLFLSDEPEPVDLCVVLGAPSPTNIEPAIRLYGSGLTKYILITGFGPEVQKANDTFIPEYAVLRDLALKAKIPENALILETFAMNTLENFTLSSIIIEAKFGWKNICSVAIAGKPMHMRRALMTARKHWPSHLKLIMQPSKNTIDLQIDTWWQTKNGQQRVFGELKAIAEYAMKSHIAGF
ncbi:DUF218 domain-containing protein [Nitrosomonas cryotolerans]|uniref:DUF218 domain-containing protein n=1 Tax=Nitrosomonas cryotolerans ATCC 49181 TaxID=1131553 RepID=A0A1N6IQV4_9PROT|nr:YdcF family protein [Nitrosomonas cryotolerans]SFP34339.1 DUF218 domain-containing protein [Nitrosomonas cryotolerans]SIO34355.1 DUF218 domain-containing protein [Nitrosomonas cryotolerans ATCC 49181]